MFLGVFANVSRRKTPIWREARASTPAADACDTRSVGLTRSAPEPVAKPMSRTSSSRPAQGWQEVLRRLAIALRGRDVGLCEADSRGRMHLLAASSAGDLDPVAVDELEGPPRAVDAGRGGGRGPPPL